MRRFRRTTARVTRAQRATLRRQVEWLKSEAPCPTESSVMLDGSTAAARWSFEPPLPPRSLFAFCTSTDFEAARFRGCSQQLCSCSQHSAPSHRLTDSASLQPAPSFRETVQAGAAPRRRRGGVLCCCSLAAWQQHHQCAQVAARANAGRSGDFHPVDHAAAPSACRGTTSSAAGQEKGGGRETRQER